MKLTAKAFKRADGMNNLEREYASLLDMERQTNRIQWWKYEAVKLRLGDGTFYTPDFMVVSKDGTVEMHETKGFMREAARVRLNTAAEMYPFRFVLVKKVGRAWHKNEV